MWSTCKPVCKQNPQLFYHKLIVRKERKQTFLKLGGNATSACQICDLLTFFKEIKVCGTHSQHTQSHLHIHGYHTCHVQGTPWIFKENELTWFQLYNVQTSHQTMDQVCEVVVLYLLTLIVCVNHSTKHPLYNNSILQGPCFVWKSATADPDVSTPTVKQALDTDFMTYVQTMAILVGVIIPSKSHYICARVCMPLLYYVWHLCVTCTH